METLERVVREGVPIASVERRKALPGKDGFRRDLHLAITYSPLTDVSPRAPEEGNIIGVLQIVQDITEELAIARRESLRVAVIGSATTAFILFALLFLIILRADRIIGRNRRRLLGQQRELEAAQAQNIQSAKLAAIGELVSGVAHELNNPLATISGLSELLATQTGEAVDPQEIALIHQEAQRAVRIVRNLPSFARASGE
jgi:signal transduction histidine kinase